MAVEVFGIALRNTPSVTTSVLLAIWGFLCRWSPTYSLVRGIVKVIMLSKYNALCVTGGELLADACEDLYFSKDNRLQRCCQGMGV